MSPFWSNMVFYNLNVQIPFLQLFISLLLQVLAVSIALSLVSQVHDCFLSVSFLLEGQGFVSEDEYLEISNIKRDQSGEYECSALNDVAAPDVRKVKITVNCELAHHQGVAGGKME